MSGLAKSLEQCTIAAKAVSIATLALTGLEHCLEVVEHQQARATPQQFQQHCEPRAFALRRHNPLVRQNADGACNPLADGRCIAQAAPVRTLESRRYAMGQPCNKYRLADAAHP